MAEWFRGEIMWHNSVNKTSCVLRLRVSIMAGCHNNRCRRTKATHFYVVFWEAYILLWRPPKTFNRTEMRPVIYSRNTGPEENFMIATKRSCLFSLHFLFSADSLAVLARHERQFRTSCYIDLGNTRVRRDVAKDKGGVRDAKDWYWTKKTKNNMKYCCWKC